MKLFKKIDLFYNGVYLCSTNQSRTCREAIASYLDRVSLREHYLGLVDRVVLKNPKGLTARFDKKLR